MAALEPVPEGFLRRLLDEFGIEWTHLVILTGVAFSSFGLERYLNPGSWILGVAGVFALVLLFRDQISRNHVRVTAGALGVAILGLAAPLLIVGHFESSTGEWIQSHSVPSTLYLALALGAPLGVIILSYRGQEEFRYQPLPTPIADVVRNSVNLSPFVHESVTYRLRLELSGGASRITSMSRIVFHYEVHMSVLNRSKQRVAYRDIFDPAGADATFYYAAVNDERLDVEAPQRQTGLGLVVEHDADAGETFSVVVHGASTFAARDSELVGAYYPCARLSITIAAPPGDLRVDVQPMVSRPAEARRLPTGEIVFEYPFGVLPFQGTRIAWAPRASTTKRR